MEDPSRPSHAAFEDRARAAFAGLTRANRPTSGEEEMDETATETTAEEDLERNRIGQPWSVSASASAAAARKNTADFSEDDEAEERVRVSGGGGGGGGGGSKAGGNGADSAAAAADDEQQRRRRRQQRALGADPLGLSREALARGFLPSEAYCRQLDREEEFDEIDAIADPGEAERRRRQRASGGGAQEGGGGGGPSTAAAESTTAVAAVSASASASALVAAVDASNAAAATKRVRFEGVAAPWVPPHRRPGWSGGIGAATISEEGGGEEATAAAAAATTTAAAAGTTVTAAAPVPDYVLHPARYTRYALGEDLTIGGGEIDDDGEMEAAAAAAATAARRSASTSETTAPAAGAPLGARLLPQDSLGAPRSSLLRGGVSGRRAPGTPVAASGPLSFSGEHEEEEEEEEEELEEMEG